MATKAAYKNQDHMFDGVKAPLEGCDRGKLPGFLKYYKARPFYFKELFGAVYSEKFATEIFKRTIR